MRVWRLDNFSHCLIYEDHYSCSNCDMAECFLWTKWSWCWNEHICHHVKMPLCVPLMWVLGRIVYQFLCTVEVWSILLCDLSNSCAICLQHYIIALIYCSGVSEVLCKSSTYSLTTMIFSSCRVYIRNLATVWVNPVLEWPLPCPVIPSLCPLSLLSSQSVIAAVTHHTGYFWYQ